jgi:hypothetical protein
MSDQKDINTVLNRVFQTARVSVFGGSIGLAQVIPYDQSRRRTPLERLARRKWEAKRREAADRKAANLDLVKRLNLKGDRK